MESEDTSDPVVTLREVPFGSVTLDRLLKEL
jgi:hypothetical protein